MTRHQIIEKLQEKRSQKTTDSDRANTNSRGDGMLELIRESIDENL